MAELTRKERLARPRQDMPTQDPAARVGNFDEVGVGFTAALAVLEAERCLQCPRPKCIEGCPVGVRIDEFVAHVAEERFDEAARVIARDNSLPAICGRVCPQENQCEGSCVMGKKHQPIAIGALERFVADFQRERHSPTVDDAPPRSDGRRVAVVGSGPAGLACATDLAREGHAVTVFEALHELGGVLVYGIPEFRLPKEIVQAEIGHLETMGVTFETNAVIGMSESIDELLEEFDAVFLGVGAGLPRFMDIPGENFVGVYSANEFLTRVNLMKAYREDSATPMFDVAGKRVVVFGGGNTAMDAARTAVRLGASPAMLMYRRSEAEMPARREEVEHAREEGVEFHMLTAPIELVGGEDGWLTGAVIQRMELGPPDEQGRRRPIPVPHSEEHIDVDVAVVAIGNTPNPLLPSTDRELRQTKWGTLIADEKTGRTTKPGVFAGGDIVTGGATVILAMGAGRKAAASIIEYLETGTWDLESGESDDTGQATAPV